MNKSKIDKKLLIAITLEITDRYELLLKLIPKEFGKERFLKHLSASSIHTALFVRDFYDYIEDKEIFHDESEDEFLEKCGCDMKEKNDKP